MAARKSRPTFTKFAREAKLRERRLAKEARRDARKEQPAADPAPEGDGSMDAPAYPPAPADA